MKKKLIAGNWKMNGSLVVNEILVKALVAGNGQGTCLVAVCVPGPYLAQVQQLVLRQQKLDHEGVDGIDPALPIPAPHQ